VREPGHFTGGVESMRTWSDWQAHTTPIGLGGIEIPGASSVFGKNLNTQSQDLGGLAQYESGNLSLGFYAGTTLGSGRAFGGGGYLTLSWAVAMNENWVMLGIGVLLVVFGLAMTAVCGPMPGAKPPYPPPLRFRLILICFGRSWPVLEQPD
jgi:hypothetical protein